jgi:hypothetical protein
MTTRRRTKNTTAKDTTAETETAAAATEARPTSGKFQTIDNPAPISAETADDDEPPPQVQPVFPGQPQAAPDLDDIHARDCVINSDCNLSINCRGRLKAGPAIQQPDPHTGKMVKIHQVYCTECRRFARGWRPLHGSAKRRLFDRRAGK